MYTDIVTHRNSKGFRVQEQNGGKSNLSFSYRVTAKRKGVKAERLARLRLAEHPTLKVPRLLPGNLVSLIGKRK